MTDPHFMDIPEPPPSKKTPPKRRPRKKPPVDEDAVKDLVRIAVLPPSGPLVNTPAVPTLRGISQRARSAVNLKIDGASYADIAATLEYDSVADCRREIERTLAATHPIDDWNTLRATVVARAERQLERSFKMAGADYLVDRETGRPVANVEKLRWHQQAGVDLMNFATITGAKAPTRVEVTPAEEQMEALVERLLAASGHTEVLEAEVIELDEVPAEEDADE